MVGGGGVGRPPQLPIPKILFHPLAILVHPLAILVHPWNMWMTSHGQCPRGGGVLVNVQEGGVFQFFGGRMTTRGQCPRGGACECPRVGAFFKLMTSRGQCPRGGGVRLVFHPSKFRPPPPPTWLAGYGPANYMSYHVLCKRGIRPARTEQFLVLLISYSSSWPPS